MHLCWASTGGPHHRDVPLNDIVDIVLKGAARRPHGSRAPTRATGTSGRSGETSSCPPGKVLIPGVIDSTTNFIEHPELVAERIERYAQLVGRENVIAGATAASAPSPAGPGRHQHRVAQAPLARRGRAPRVRGALVSGRV